ncbi:hypothetical protein [Staphylococcus sp. Marseille-Q5304]|uniref:hypothetical protein n=1 Tax=Staphylococcus sp. Marseille-Q5304 TaxID=2942200 RepID=UPI00207354EB|nr:hypothetical protein [Staphylococcus sp. Marseille-Q5304]
MNYITTYLEKMTKNSINTSLVEYQKYLDKKLRSVEMYIKYLIERKDYLGELIHQLTVTLENRYMDVLDEIHVSRAQAINDEEIEQIKQELNEMEADYARIESDLSYHAEEKVNIETECDLIERLSLVA